VETFLYVAHLMLHPNGIHTNEYQTAVQSVGNRIALLVR